MLTFLIGFAAIDIFVQLIHYDDTYNDLVNELMAQRNVINSTLTIVLIAGVIAGFVTVWLLGKREFVTNNGVYPL